MTLPLLTKINLLINNNIIFHFSLQGPDYVSETES